MPKEPTILFHARLLDDKIVIEDDNFEEGLTNALIKAGISSEIIINGLSLEENHNTAITDLVVD